MQVLAVQAVGRIWPMNVPYREGKTVPPSRLPFKNELMVLATCQIIWKLKKKTNYEGLTKVWRNEDLTQDAYLPGSHMIPSSWPPQPSAVNEGRPDSKAYRPALCTVPMQFWAAFTCWACFIIHQVTTTYYDSEKDKKLPFHATESRSSDCLWPSRVRQLIGAVYTKSIEAAAGSCGSPPRPIDYSGISIHQTSYFGGEQNALFKTFSKNISVQYGQSGRFHTGEGALRAQCVVGTPSCPSSGTAYSNSRRNGPTCPRPSHPWAACRPGSKQSEKWAAPLHFHSLARRPLTAPLAAVAATASAAGHPAPRWRWSTGPWPLAPGSRAPGWGTSSPRSRHTRGRRRRSVLVTRKAARAQETAWRGAASAASASRPRAVPDPRRTGEVADNGGGRRSSSASWTASC